MCFEYRERVQRLEELRREDLEQRRGRDEKEFERTTLERLDWPAPEGPIRSRDEKVPA